MRAPIDPPKLGWVQTPPDPRTLKMAAYTTAELPTPPAWVDWLSKIPATGWPMFRNDAIGDCMPTACAHLDQAWLADAGNAAPEITDNDVVTAYSGISGYDPGTGANDNGCEPLAALNYWRKVGIAGRRIDAYVQLNVRNHTEVKAALSLFGGLVIGADLPKDAAAQNRRRLTWRPMGGPNGQPGSWGAHALHVGAYNAQGLTSVTWGMLQRMTWPWWDEYVFDAYAVLSSDWISKRSGASPAGVKMDELAADLHRVTA